jgi:hypothetical protein
MSTPEEFFHGSPAGLALYEVVADLVATIGPTDVTVGKSQIAFRAPKGFAYVWRPRQYLSSGAPAVLSIALPQELHSPRFKQVAPTARDVWMHHLELKDPQDVDGEVRGWLTAAYKAAS